MNNIFPVSNPAINTIYHMIPPPSARTVQASAAPAQVPTSAPAPTSMGNPSLAIPGAGKPGTPAAGVGGGNRFNPFLGISGGNKMSRG